MDYQKSIETIANHYGEKKQNMMMVEECSELIKAICKYSRKPGQKECENIIEELADVQIMVDQMIYLTHAGDEIAQVIVEKLERQLKRIEEE